MVTREGLQFQLSRVTGTFRVMFKNRMAVVGLILLFGFVFAALGAPLLTPYGPTEKVSGLWAQPDWVMNFPDGYYLSKNIVVVKDPLFNFSSIYPGLDGLRVSVDAGDLIIKVCSRHCTERCRVEGVCKCSIRSLS